MAYDDFPGEDSQQDGGNQNYYYEMFKLFSLITSIDAVNVKFSYSYFS